ncbi:alpha/beta fold hydrolase [Streptomyces violaceus]|uniref:alpha/beta fold hydrolase n=1 Tax=Streptomyces violaceus TaxID=1936 RepID=UPI003806BEE7
MLAAHRPTVVLDVPGQPGLSADVRPRRGRSEWYGRWLTEALEQAVPGPDLVVGHSLGGAVVLASDSPRIAGRLLLSSAGLVRLRVPPGVVAATAPWLARPTPASTARVLRRMVAPGGRLPDELTEWMTPVARTCHSSLAPPPLPPELLAERRSVPCVVATGRHDVFLPPQRLGPAAQRHLGARFHVLDSSGACRWTRRSGRPPRHVVRSPRRASRPRRDPRWSGRRSPSRPVPGGGGGRAACRVRSGSRAGRGSREVATPAPGPPRRTASPRTGRGEHLPHRLERRAGDHAADAPRARSTGS